jgi:nucleotide-binding universal stress UspA family protein
MKTCHYLVAIDPNLEVQNHFEWIKNKFLNEGDSVSIIAVLPESQEIDSSGSEEMVRIQIQSLLSSISTANVEKKSFVVFGNPAQEIVKLSSELNPTTIVMCSIKNALSSFVLGSVCEAVLKSSKIAVMVYK